MSHTVTVNVEFRDPGAFRAAVEACGWAWLGKGEHRLYSTTATGNGFQIPGWRYPVALNSAGRLEFDDASRYDTPYGLSAGHGRTADENGQVPEFERLKARYAIEAARHAAEAQGWYTEIAGEILTIYHPTGGTLTVDGTGAVDAQGFQGAGCLGAVTSIGEAIGAIGGLTAKPEFAQELATVAAVE